MKVTGTKWRNKDRIVAQAYHFYVNYNFYISSWIEDKKVPNINVMAEICFWCKTFKTSSFFTFFCLVFIIRAANNFLAGAGQIIQSNLFLLGHIPFLARQTSIIIILNL